MKVEKLKNTCTVAEEYARMAEKELALEVLVKSELEGYREHGRIDKFRMP